MQMPIHRRVIRTVTPFMNSAARLIDDAVIRVSKNIARLGMWLATEYRFSAIAVSIATMLVLIEPYQPSHGLWVPAALLFYAGVLMMMYAHTVTQRLRNAFAVLLGMTLFYTVVALLLGVVDLIALHG